MEYEVIVTILNRGFSDLVMDSARASGAKGGTIITARGTGTKEVQRLFGLTISQEKEIILILTPKEQRNAIMSAICRSAGLNTQGKGITFSLPVSDVLGVSFGFNNPEKTDESPKQKADAPQENTVESALKTTEPEQKESSAETSEKTDEKSTEAVVPSSDQKE